MPKEEIKDVVIDADHIVYRVASEPAKAFKSSLCGNSIKPDKITKEQMKKLKASFMAIVDGYVKTAEVESISYDWGIGETIICISDKSNFRYDIYPEYKANRPPATALIKKLRKWARKKFALKQNIEADDAVAHHIRNGAICFTEDKDIFKGLAGLMYNAHFHHKCWVNTSEEDAYKFNLTQYVMGDLGDNIRGIEGVGIKTAIKLLDKHGWDWNGVLQSYYEKGYTEADAILTRRLVSMNQWSPKKGLKLFGETK